MDNQSLFNVGAGAILAISGWFVRQLWDAVQDLKTDLHDLEVKLPERYLSKEDFSSTMKEIKDMLRHISDKLDDKADK
jgi:predicted RNA-binding protein with EMAP domain